MEEITKYLQIYSNRHPEYKGYVHVDIYRDSSGCLYGKKLMENPTYFHFRGMNEFKRICQEE